MKAIHTAIAAAALVLVATGAGAQYYSPGDPTTDHRWVPDNSGFAAGTVGVPSPVVGAAGGSTGGSGQTSKATPPAAEQKGYWVGTLDCAGIQVCGPASASRGWGFATWVQHWTCQGGSTCGAYPAGYATDNVACQTSAGNLGYIFGQQCYLGAASS